MTLIVIIDVANSTLFNIAAVVAAGVDVLETFLTQITAWQTVFFMMIMVMVMTLIMMIELWSLIVLHVCLWHCIWPHCGCYAVGRLIRYKCGTLQLGRCAIFYSYSLFLFVLDILGNFADLQCLMKFIYGSCPIAEQTFSNAGKFTLLRLAFWLKRNLKKKTFKPFVEAQFKIWNITNCEMGIYWISNFKIFHVKIKAQFHVAAKMKKQWSASTLQCERPIIVG